jgi:hypothetical protein
MNKPVELCVSNTITMKPKLLLCLALVLTVSPFCISAHADIPAYSPTRNWVEKQCTTNTTPKNERIFIGHAESSDYASIIRFHMGISLREIIDGTQFKGKTVSVVVMRPGWMSKIIVVKPTETPGFDVKPLDVIWIYDRIPEF